MSRGEKGTRKGRLGEGQGWGRSHEEIRDGMTRVGTQRNFHV